MGHLSDVPMTAPSNFERLVMEFLRIKNGSNLERSLLSTIKSYDANGRKSKKILITLLYSIHTTFPLFNLDSRNMFYLRMNVVLLQLSIMQNANVAKQIDGQRC